MLIEHPELAGDYQVRSLGIDAETTEQIFGFIQSREKVATFSLPWVIEANQFPHPKVGMPILLCDYDGMPRLVVKRSRAPAAGRCSRDDGAVGRLLQPE